VTVAPSRLVGASKATEIDRSPIVGAIFLGAFGIRFGVTGADAPLIGPAPAKFVAVIANE
jgi:hypothetical protein